MYCNQNVLSYNKVHCVFMWFIFFNSNEYQIFKKIIALEYEFPSGFPEVPKGLVQSLLVSDLLCYFPLDGI